MIIRVRSRDGLERVTVDNRNITVFELKTLIQNQLKISIVHQTLSMNKNLLLAKTLEDLHWFTDMSNCNSLISSLGISHGSIIYMAYEGERYVTGPIVSKAGSFGKKMTMDDLIAKQMRITRQENSHCESVSFDRDTANVFQKYVSESLGFAVKRGGFMYGIVSTDRKVEVNFIYEPPQEGTEENLILLRNFEEEKLVERIALMLGMRKVGFIFTQTINQNKKDCTLSNLEILQAVELHAQSGLKEWVTAVVKLEVNEGGCADVHFEAFQMSDMCIRLFKEGWFDVDSGGIDPKLSRMKKEVVFAGKDTKEVDNDVFLVLVKIFDHQGPLSSTFPIENRNTPVTMKAMKNHLDWTKSLTYVKRISDFHLLLLLARYLDLSANFPALADCLQAQTIVPEGYQLLIEGMAGISL